MSSLFCARASPSSLLGGSTRPACKHHKHHDFGLHLHDNLEDVWNLNLARGLHARTFVCKSEVAKWLISGFRNLHIYFLALLAPLLGAALLAALEGRSSLWAFLAFSTSRIAGLCCNLRFGMGFKAQGLKGTLAYSQARSWAFASLAVALAALGELCQSCSRAVSKRNPGAAQ